MKKTPPSVLPYSRFPKEKTYGGTSTIFQLAEEKTLPNVGVDYVVLGKGKNLKPHYHRFPRVLILVLSGNGFVHLNGKEKPIKSGDVITIPPKTIHGFRASSTKLVFVSIQTPSIYGKATKKTLIS